jgi:hypothetical protein
MPPRSPGFAVRSRITFPHLALLFHSEQEPLFHQLHQCFFRKARLPRYPIVQVTPGNGRRVQVVGGVRPVRRYDGTIVYRWNDHDPEYDSDMVFVEFAHGRVVHSEFISD